MQGKQSVTKNFGRVYTPVTLVKIILDFVGYTTDVTHKHIIDNSCGNGAFLSEIVDRYCSSFLSKSSDTKQLRKELECFIHGIEIDEEESISCKSNLDNIAYKYGVKNVRWDIVCGDTLTQKQFNGRMDFVVGNPPYVRVHNLERSYDVVREFSFSQGGMTDLFIVFFQIGFQMLSENGRMCIITPSSWLTSKAGNVLRQYILLHKNLSGVVDLEHYQAFDATTYTIISRFDNLKNNAIDYFTFDGQMHTHGVLSYTDFSINDGFYISEREQLHNLHTILSSEIGSYVKVKNGFATLADKIFIGDFDFSEYTIDIIKASTGKWQKCIFPYDNQGRPLPEKTIRKSKAYQYLFSQKETLSKGRSIETNQSWYLFGRTQALNDVCKRKIAINSIIKDKESIKLNLVPAGKGVYSGLYILTDVDFKVIQQIVYSNDFVQYIQSLKKYKSGGYYTFSSKDLELYLNYKIHNNND